MVQIRWTSLAVEDLKSICDFIARDSAKYAKIQVFRIKSRTSILKTNPLAGKTVPELDHPQYRELIEGNFRIIYKVIHKNRIDILTIHHSSRDLTHRQFK